MFNLYYFRSTIFGSSYSFAVLAENEGAARQKVNTVILQGYVLERDEWPEGYEMVVLDPDDVLAVLTVNFEKK
jgi:hypothetical protein